MLNYKKLLVLGIAAFAILTGLTKIRTSRMAMTDTVSCVESCASFSKADDFSIVNILSVKFR